jgi:hypothetical protein
MRCRHILGVGQIYMLLHFQPSSFLSRHLVKVAVIEGRSVGYQQDNHQ